MQGLAKRFGGIEVFTDVSAVIPHGKITAVIGPNGAGKSTLINIVCGVLRAEEGRLRRTHGTCVTFGRIRLLSMG